jgi:hypothetical protein
MAWPLFLSDGRHFVYISVPFGIYLGSLDSPNRKLLKTIEHLTVLGFTEPDSLLFAGGGTLFAQAIDLRTWTLAGDAMRVAEEVEMNAPASSFSASRTGALIYSSGSRTITEPTWVRWDGSAVGPAIPRGPFNQFRLSRDGRQIAVDRL